MRKLCISIGVTSTIIGSVLFGRLFCDKIDLSNGLWWSALTLVAGLLLILDWLGGEDDGDTD